MFCNSCGKKIDDDSLFCSECGAKINRIAIDSISSDKVKVSLAKPSGNNTDEKNQENENSDLSDSLYTPESNQQTEFSPKDDSVSETVPENETENFFGSTEPISHINPEPKQESVEEIQKTIDEYNNEEHKENMPKMVLKKNVEKHDENIKENHSGQFDDNQNTQYIPMIIIMTMNTENRSPLRMMHRPKIFRNMSEILLIRRRSLFFRSTDR